MCWTSVWNSFCLLYWFAVISQVSPQSCPSNEACRGNRPRTPKYGCCPSPPRGDCYEGDGYGRECDAELGYSCVQFSEEGGVCTGPFELTESNVQYEHLTLNWTFSLPHNYSLEYSVLQTTEFSTNLTNWTATEVGNEPACTVRHLSEGTLYFLRIGVWDERFKGIYRNLSEILMVKTLDRPAGCTLGNGSLVSVGSEVHLDCESICQCLPNGSLNCRDKCQGVVHMVEGLDLVCELVPAGEEYPECCQRLECVAHDGHCLKDGIRHENNTIVEKLCTICECQNGDLMCLQRVECEYPERGLCPRLILTEPRPGECCPIHECPSDCIVGNDTYEHGDSFHSECERCICQKGEAKCEPMCERLSVPVGCRTRIPEGECCPELYCGSPVTECTFEGETYPVNARFTSGCLDCYCSNEGSTDCIPMCSDPPVVPASPVCPDPQYHEVEDECCPLLWCHSPGNGTSPNVVRSPKASSLELESVTIEFRPPDNTGLKMYMLGYDVHYNYDVDVGNPELWPNKFISLNELETLDKGLEVTSIVNITHGSWLLNGSVVTTIFDLSSNTTYFFCIRVRLNWEEAKGHFQPERWASIPQIQGRQPPVSVIPFSDVIAARTLSGDDVSCIIGNQTVRHGETYRDGCTEECVCRYRTLQCRTLCAEERLQPSVSCARPVLENITGECCPRWRCYPETGGCFYGNGTLRNGDLVREGCDQYCRCDNGTINCWPVCKQVGPPRRQCERVVSNNRCCPTWKCPPERKLPVAIETLLTFTLAGTCDYDDPSFTNRLVERVIQEFRSRQVCPEGSIPDYIIMCEPSQFTVICPRYVADSNPKRHTGSALITVVMKIKAMNNDTVDNSLALYSLVQKVINATSTNFVIRFGGEIHPVVSPAEVTRKSIICQRGYIKQEEACVAGYIISSNQSISFHVTLNTTSVTKSSATIRWYGLPHEELDYLDELMLEYRDLTLDGDWISTHKLHSSVKVHVLQHLKPATLYVVRLILLTSSFGVSRYTAASSFFQTLQDYIPQHIRPNLTVMDVSTYSVTLHWDALSESLKSSVEELFISYKRVFKDGHETKYKRTEGISPTESKYTLCELLPDTIYKVKVGVMLTNGTTVFSLTADLRTQSVPGSTERPSSSELNTHRGVIIGVSVVAILAVTAVILLIVFFLRKGRGSSRLSSSSSETNFENKLYDMEETDHRVWKK